MGLYLAPHDDSVSFHLLIVCVFLQADRVEEQFTFQYGPCKGDPGFREQLANFLSQEYGDVVDRLVYCLLPALSDSYVMLCLQSYQRLRIDRSLMY